MTHKCNESDNSDKDTANRDDPAKRQNYKENTDYSDNHINDNTVNDEPVELSDGNTDNEWYYEYRTTKVPAATKVMRARIMRPMIPVTTRTRFVSEYVPAPGI